MLYRLWTISEDAKRNMVLLGIWYAIYHRQFGETSGLKGDEAACLIMHR